jgi:group II intron reverse transcriptase/maturase
MKTGKPNRGDPLEERGGQAMEPLEGTMAGPQSPADISTILQRIAEQSRKDPARAWNTLAHHINPVFLREAFEHIRKDGAPGVDGKSATDYAVRLDENLSALADAFHSGRYRAPPVRRVYIPKDNGKRRPIGIPTIEDKILQRAVTTVLEAVYEQDFLDCSFGFRKGRSAHQALEYLQRELVLMHGGFVIDVDIESFFDSLDHGALRTFLDRRIRDGVLRRAIDKWLKAGVMEDGVVERAEAGSPQGGVISPLLANIYLHEVLDVWFERMVKPVLRGRAFMVRYADDAVLAFAREDDARRVLEALPKRLAKFGLRLNAAKTRLVPFERPPKWPPEGPTGAGPGSFNFLGFTHYWAKSRQGNNVVKRKTAKERLRRAIHRASEWCQRHRHLPVRAQWRSLVKKLQGHYAYYGITGNARSLTLLYRNVRKLWRKWLDRRSQRARVSWARYARLLERYPLPQPRIVHPWHPANPSS